MRRVVILATATAIAVAGAGACASARLPAPPYVQQKTEAMQEVDFPPPPARVEFVPPAPNAAAVWIDGEWTWQGRRWAWKPGRWIAPPANAAYSPWTSVRDKIGTIYVAEGKWRDKSGRELPDPKPLATARARGGPVVNAEGEDVPSAPDVQPQTERQPAGGANKTDARSPETPSGTTPTGTEPKSGPTLDAGAD